LETQLSTNISTWMNHRHLNTNTSKSKPLFFLFSNPTASMVFLLLSGAQVKTKENK
jgi:hypothetical protein